MIETPTFHVTIIDQGAMRAEPYLRGVFLHLHQVLLCIIFVLSSLPTTSGLYVVSGSICTSACFSNSTGSAYTTNASDVRCYDGDYSTTDAGIGFQDCVACEFQSPTFDHATTQTDTGWALCKYLLIVSWSCTSLDVLTFVSQYQIFFKLVSVPLHQE